MEPKVIKIEIKVTKTIVTVLAGLLLVALGLLAVTSAGARPPLEGPGGQGEVTVASTVPKMISYQGQLLDSGGNLVPDGTYTMTFKLYNVASGGTEFWMEAHSNVQVTDGLFNVLLGEFEPLWFMEPEGEIYPLDPLDLGVTVGSDPEMTPRQRMVSVPFAFRAEIADQAVQAPPDDDWDGAGTGKMYTHYLTDTVGIGTRDPQGLLQVGEGSFIVTPAGWVGINDDDPDAKLEVSVDGQTTPDLFMLSSDVNTDGDRFIVKNNGSVGIGTNNPQTELHVVDTRKSTSQGNIDFWPNGILVESNSATPDVNHSPRLGLVDTSLGSITTAPAWYIGNWADRFQIFRQPNIQSTGVDFLNIVNTGNVGIGTREPSERLDVDGRVKVRDLPAGPNLNDIVVANSEGVLHKRNASTLGGADADWYEAGTTTPPNDIEDNIYTHGKVGISTTTPQAELDVNGDIIAYRVRSGVGTAQPLRLEANGALLLTADGNNDEADQRINFYINGETDPSMKMTILENGNVGIGTTTPQGPLQVGEESFIVTAENKVGIGTLVPGAELDVTSPINAYIRANKNSLAQAGGFVLAAGGTNKWFILMPTDSEDLWFYDSEGPQIPEMVIKRGTGNVGIGTANPQSTLQVEGNPGYLQIDSINVVSPPSPPGADCSISAHIGRMILTYDSTSSYLCVCKPKPSRGWSCVSLP